MNPQNGITDIYIAIKKSLDMNEEIQKKLNGRN
jgi:hypothetical protein